MRVILVDDEPIALEVLSSVLSTYNSIQIAGCYTDPHLALEEINEVNPDVIFLDIEMGHVSGLEIAQLLISKRDSVEIVFTTAYSKYAVDAFELNAIDYLLKPIQKSRLDKTMHRLRNCADNQIKQTGNKLIINSFGLFEVMDSCGNQLLWRTQKSKELFAYLWEQNGRPVAKALIMENIFYDKNLDKATTLLHTTVYQLRKSLGKLGHTNGILYFNDSYQLNLPIVSDFEDLIYTIEKKNYKDNDILRILEIYKGDFLENEGYHWAMGIQQNYKDLVFNILSGYSKIQLQGANFTLLLKICLDKMYELEPFNDNVANLIIQYYGNKGEKSKLESFFNDYTENLSKEMNLKPSGSTLNLYQRYSHNTK